MPGVFSKSLPPRAFEPPPSFGVCENCGRWSSRPLLKWGDTFAMTHGAIQYRCGRCVYGEQLRHALARTARIPGLLWRLLRSL